MRDGSSTPTLSNPAESAPRYLPPQPELLGRKDERLDPVAFVVPAILILATLTIIAGLLS